MWHSLKGKTMKPKALTLPDGFGCTAAERYTPASNPASHSSSEPSLMPSNRKVYR